MSAATTWVLEEYEAVRMDYAVARSQVPPDWLAFGLTALAVLAPLAAAATERLDRPEHPLADLLPRVHAPFAEAADEDESEDLPLGLRVLLPDGRTVSAEDFISTRG